MRGTRQYPMHECPFTLIQVTITMPDGRPRYHRPLWLAFFGPKRQAWAPKLIYEAYRQRFDQERMHRFLPRNLLVTAYETPDTAHEERWWRIVALAYGQHWLARSLAQTRWRPREKHLARKHGPSPPRALSPTHVQRDFLRILSQMGTPARRLKPRGKSGGWPLGRQRNRRPRRKIVRKGRQKAASPPSWLGCQGPKQRSRVQRVLGSDHFAQCPVEFVKSPNGVSIAEKIVTEVRLMAS
ncbi:MAG: hypothetical protein Q9O62_10425 [Ardenticatenia bacterium]|nr:hypothetical protein [Ardenticatenia bacterium]